MNQFVPEPAQTRPPVEFQAAFGHWNNTNLQKVGEKVLGELKIDDLSGAVSGADRKNLQFMHSEYGVNTSMDMAGGLDQNSLNLNVLYNPKSGDRSQSVMMQSRWDKEGEMKMAGLQIRKEGEYSINVRLDSATGRMIGVKAEEEDAKLINALNVALSASGRESNRGAVSFVEDQRGFDEVANTVGAWLTPEVGELVRKGFNIKKTLQGFITVGKLNVEKGVAMPKIY